MTATTPKSAKSASSPKSPNSPKSPLTLVKDKFGDKGALVKAVEAFTSNDLWVARTNEDKGLAHVSNAKLLRLHNIFTEVKEKFGTREKLIDGILDIEKRTKDEGYKSRLSHFPVPRLFDQYKAAAKRVKAAASKGVKGAKAIAKIAKKAEVKAAAAKAVAAKAPAKPTKSVPNKKGTKSTKYAKKG